MRPRAEIVAHRSVGDVGRGGARVLREPALAPADLRRDARRSAGLRPRARRAGAARAERGGRARAKFTDRSLARIRRDILFVPQSMTLATLVPEDAVEPHSPGAGRRRIWRHRRPRLDGRSGRTDRRRHRRRTRRRLRACARTPKAAFEADGRAPIDELEAKLGASLALPDHEDEFDTAAGLAVALAGRVAAARRDPAPSRRASMSRSSTPIRAA